MQDGDDPAEGLARLDLAGLHYLVALALAGKTANYADFAKVVGGIPQGQGPRLTRIGEWCRARKLPLLSILIVSTATGKPSVDAAFYETVGVTKENAIETETRRCFDFDWSRAKLPEAKIL